MRRRAAVDCGDSHVLEQLLRHGADILACDNQGHTPLALVLQFGHRHHAGRLCEAGVKQ